MPLKYFMELFINHYMLNKIVKYTMMEYLPDEPKIEDEINPKRFFKYAFAARF